MGFLRVTVFLISLSYHGKSEKIRCYCNLEECISNNFLCSYEDGGCFSDFLDYRDIPRAKHGCLHLLKSERQEQCGNVPELPIRPSTSLLFCCKTDLCNQVLSPASLFTHSFIGSLINATEGQNGFMNLNEDKNYDHRRYTNEVWFKAATIAVPICGAMILLLLVALAFKILRADHLSADRYRSKGKSNANYTESHMISFKTSELNSKDFSKQIPLLYETRQNELQNSENFRKYTSARIHFGQNVNSLRNEKDSSCKVEKNVENEKINLGMLRTRQRDAPNSSGAHQPDDPGNVLSAEDESNSTLDVRVRDEELSALPTVSLNLEKPENLSNYNLCNNLSSGDHSSLNVMDLNKMYDKHLL